jgi:hypothetical protein
MESLLEEIRWEYALGLAAVAWLAFAAHPTARGFRTAVLDTLSA